MGNRLRDTSRSRGASPPTKRSTVPYVGQMASFVRNPYRFVKQLADEYGEVAAFEMMGQRMVLLTGDEASELFYKSSDDMLDQSAAYKVMTPIFGEGLVFDAPIERKNEQLRALMPSLRQEAMRNHSSKIIQEVQDAIADWGDAGELDLGAFMKQLTINTASHCLLGKEFRYELSEEFSQIYEDLEKGVTPIAYNFPDLPLPAFKRRDAARARLEELVGGIVRRRAARDDKPDDLFQSLIEMEYKDGARLTHNEITGLLIAAIFAGHHTSSGTATWVMLELLKHPEVLRKTTRELDEMFGSEGEITFKSMREVPQLEAVIKEVLRLHPPLIILMRQVTKDLHFKGMTIRAGDMVWASPAVTHRMPSLFDNPEVFDPDRFSPERHEDDNLMAYQPFGGGHHKCSGNAFAMFQIKVIFAELLRRYEFQLVAPPETYVDDYNEMIVQPKAPARVRYRCRDASSFTSTHGSHGARQKETTVSVEDAVGADHPTLQIVLDKQLCQGHAMCMGDAPSYFHVDADGDNTVLVDTVAMADLATVDQAIRNCPNKALSLRDATQKEPA